MLSTSIFSSNGSIYQQSAVFGTTFQLNDTALVEVGLPALTGSNAWTNLTANLAVRPYLNNILPALKCVAQIGGLIAHCIFFWGGYAKDSFKLAYTRTQPDPHYQVRYYASSENRPVTQSASQAMKKYKEAPFWWYLVLLVLSFVAGL
jgi:hypothetical protein